MKNLVGYIQALIAAVVLGTTAAGIVAAYRYLQWFGIFAMVCCAVMMALSIVYVVILVRRKLREPEYIAQEGVLVVRGKAEEWFNPTEQANLARYHPAPSTYNLTTSEQEPIPRLSAPPVRWSDVVEINDDGKIALGIDGETGELLTAEWKEIISMAVVGPPGSGKTHALMWFGAQAINQGGTIDIASIHPKITDDFAGIPGVSIATTVSETEDMLGAVEEDMYRRISLGEDYPHIPRSVIVDEGLHNTTKRITQLSRSIICQSRKAKICMQIGSQAYPADLLTAEARRQMQSAIVMRNTDGGEAYRFMPASLARPLLERIYRSEPGRAVAQTMSMAPRIITFPQYRLPKKRSEMSWGNEGEISPRPFTIVSPPIRSQISPVSRFQRDEQPRVIDAIEDKVKRLFVEHGGNVTKVQEKMGWGRGGKRHRKIKEIAKRAGVL